MKTIAILLVAAAATLPASGAPPAPTDPCALAGGWTLSSFKLESQNPEFYEEGERPSWLPQTFTITCPKLLGSPALEYDDGKGRVSIPRTGRDPLEFKLVSKGKGRTDGSIHYTGYTMRLGPDGDLVVAALSGSRRPGQETRPWEGHSMTSLQAAAVYVRPKPAPPAGAPGVAKVKEAPRGPLSAEGGKALTDKAAAMGQALLPTKKDEKLPAASESGSEPWRADAREMHKIWACRHPRTADMSLCEFAARELRAHDIPWRLALANWDFATDLLPTHRYSAGGMTAEGLTDASWQWCKDHRDVVQGLLGRPGRRSDLYNPRASILWWIAEFEEQRAKMGAKTDPWRVAAGVFLPAAPYGKRAEQELRAWRSTIAKQDRCVLSQKTKP
jgi:hypothetical protein